MLERLSRSRLERWTHEVKWPVQQKMGRFLTGKKRKTRDAHRKHIGQNSNMNKPLSIMGNMHFLFLILLFQWNSTWKIFVSPVLLLVDKNVINSWFVELIAGLVINPRSQSVLEQDAEPQIALDGQPEPRKMSHCHQCVREWVNESVKFKVLQKCRALTIYHLILYCRSENIPIHDITSWQGIFPEDQWRDCSWLK